MNMIWLCLTSVLSVTRVISAQIIDSSNIEVFPKQSIAGVFLASYLNDLNVLQYAFNASEARRLCLSLGVTIATKAEVNQALSRGLETCRFGWIDEHFAVIPRNRAQTNCGKNKTGLVTWRASVKQKFDVFCFNESDAAAQLKDTTTDSPLNTSDSSGQTVTPSMAASSTQIMHSSSSPLPSSSPTSKIVSSEAEAAPLLSIVNGSSKDFPSLSISATAILITAACGLILLAVIIVAYVKIRRRSRDLSSEEKQKEKSNQAEELTCLKNITETEKASQEDERTEVDGDES